MGNLQQISYILEDKKASLTLFPKREQWRDAEIFIIRRKSGLITKC